MNTPFNVGISLIHPKLTYNDTNEDDDVIQKNSDDDDDSDESGDVQQEIACK